MRGCSITTAALTRETRHLKYIVTFRPDAIAPTLAAQMAATFQRVSKGRLLLNIVIGSDEEEQHRFGDWLDHDARYARASEFLTTYAEHGPAFRSPLPASISRWKARLLALPGSSARNLPWRCL